MASTIIDLNQVQTVIDAQVDTTHFIASLLKGIRAIATQEDQASIECLVDLAIEKVDALGNELDSCSLSMSNRAEPAKVEG